MPTFQPDQPAGPALLDAARRALLDEVVPALDGRPRYVALMVANAVGIALREAGATEAAEDAWARASASVTGRPDASGAALAAAIRAGAADGDAELHAALSEAAAVAARVAKAPTAGDG